MLLSLSRFVALSLLLLAALAASAQAAKWQNFKYPEAGFRASFPVEPQLAKNEQQAQNGSIHLLSYCAPVEDATLCVAVIDQVMEAAGVDANTMLQRAELAAYTGAGTRKIGERDLTLEGNKGQEIETQNGTMHTLTRIYLVGETLYQVVVTNPVSKRCTGAEKFLDSFHLIKRLQP